MFDEEEFSGHLERGLAGMGLPPLPAPGRGRLWRYFVELDRWGRKMDLVAPAPDLVRLESHFLDSLSLLAALGDGPLLDVGSGAGFPGLVVKTARPGLAVTLVEPRRKRVDFLKHLIRLLGLAGVEVVEGRVEAEGGRFAAVSGQFPAITSRALTEVDPFLALVERLSPPQGQVLCMKGPKAEAELASWRRSSPASPFALERRLDFRLPFSGAGRSLLIFRRQEAQA